MPGKNPSLTILCPRCYRRATVEAKDGRLYYVHNIADTGLDFNTKTFRYCLFEQSPAVSLEDRAAKPWFDTEHELEYMGLPLQTVLRLKRIGIYTVTQLRTLLAMKSKTRSQIVLTLRRAYSRR